MSDHDESPTPARPRRGPARGRGRVTTHVRARLLVVAAVVCTVVAVHVAGGHLKRESLRARQQLAAVDGLRQAMIDQESGLRGYAQTSAPVFLGSYDTGRRAWVRQLAEARRLLDREPAAGQLRRQSVLALEWQERAVRAVAAIGYAGPGALTVAGARDRKASMDRFRAAHGRLREAALRQGDAAVEGARRIVDAAVVLTGVLFGLLGLALVERRARAERRRREEESDFLRALQASRDEAAAVAVVVRHVARIVPGAAIEVFGAAGAGAAACPGCRPLTGADVDAAGPCSGGPGGDRLCVPLIAGGRALASVLVRHSAPLDARRRERVHQAVQQASPAVANLRNLAVAERLAATDPLTGLPNKRSIERALTRMVAQARRQASPLAALVLDLDRFKSLNDRFGHPAGDAVLAAVGRTLCEALRASDFSGRWGGEEFVALLPGEDAAGALVVARQARDAIARLRVDGVPTQVTATIGVAAFPSLESEDALLRAADEALYAGKRAGRNQVVLFSPGPAVADEPSEPAPAASGT